MDQTTEVQTNDVVMADENATVPATVNENQMVVYGPNEAPAASPDPANIFKHRWEVKNYLEIKENRINGPAFKAADVEWTILFFPRGNRDYSGTHLSMYLDLKNAKFLPYEWERTIKFVLILVNQVDPAKSVHKESTYSFSSTNSDWGFSQFEKLSTIRDPESGFLVDGTLVIEAELEVLKSNYVSWSTYDSKKETGFVGLKNQGATCYMNSLLQALYHTPKFRKAVYMIPSDSDLQKNTIPFALQRVFYRLQVSEHSVATKELTKSFGWEGSDSFVQHDVQELNRVLSDNLEQKMKGTPSDGVISELFEGKTENYIKCINVEYESKREESFYDLSLNVKGCKNIYESFEQYIEEETLDGDNKYQAEGHGLQDAKKGIRFSKLPPVLHIQLKRFEYDPYRDAMVKVNDRYEFPVDLDLNKFISPEAAGGISQEYSLHGVLVHAGDVHGGHYYAFLRPNAELKWFKFDDDRVTVSDAETAIDDNFGGDHTYTYTTYGGKKQTTVSKKFANAYMLVYFRKHDYPDILCEAKTEEIDVKVREHFEHEINEEEIKRKEKAEAHLYMQIKVISSIEMKEYDAPGLVDISKVKEIRVKKSTTLKDFKSTAQELFGIPAERQRYWKWIRRQNSTFRLNNSIPGDDESRTLEDLMYGINDKILFLEDVDEESMQDLKSDTLIFFKKFDVASQKLSIVGHGLFKQSEHCETFVDFIRRIESSVDKETPIVLYEEVTPSDISIINPELTIGESKIISGDIVVFYFYNPDDSSVMDPVPAYYDHIMNKISVEFRLLSKPKETLFKLELSKKNTYDQVVEILGKRIEALPNYIRLTGHNSWNDTPKYEPIKRSERLTLNEMLYQYSYSSYQGPDIFFYEILELPLSEYEGKKTVKVHWMSPNGEETEHSIFLPKDSTIEDVETNLRPLLKLEGGTEKIRFVEVWAGKVLKVFTPSDKITYITDYVHLRADEITQEELDAKADPENYRVLTVHHITKTHYYYNCYGNPISVVIKKGQTVADLKAHIHTRMGVAEDQIAKWKAGVMTYSKVEYLEDNIELFDLKFDEVREYFGFDHPAPKTATKSRVVEKSIRIYN